MVKFKATDILNQKIVFRQYPKFMDGNGVVHDRVQTSKKFSPGSYFALSLQLTL